MIEIAQNFLFGVHTNNGGDYKVQMAFAELCFVLKFVTRQRGVNVSTVGLVAQRSYGDTSHGVTHGASQK